MPPGMCVRRLADVRPRPAVGLIVPDREPRSLVADALVESVRAVDLAAALSEQLPAGANDETGRAPSRQR
ncbi:hypothetical protein [Pseudonocardia sp.]|uniref:hypothetical protein n=1 Tax=Pseudonocardia sp. TaxID=60912 RepID=UPI003D0FDC76